MGRRPPPSARPKYAGQWREREGPGGRLPKRRPRGAGNQRTDGITNFGLSSPAKPALVAVVPRSMTIAETSSGDGEARDGLSGLGA